MINIKRFTTLTLIFILASFATAIIEWDNGKLPVFLVSSAILAGALTYKEHRERKNWANLV